MLRMWAKQIGACSRDNQARHGHDQMAQQGLKIARKKNPSLPLARDGKGRLEYADVPKLQKAHLTLCVCARW